MGQQVRWSINRDHGDWVHREQGMRVDVRVRHLMIARVVGLIVSWVGEGTVYILQEVDCPHRRTRPESEGKVKGKRVNREGMDQTGEAKTERKGKG